MNEITLQQKIDMLTALINYEVSLFVDFMDDDDEGYSEVLERSRQCYAIFIAILSDYAPHSKLEFSDDFEEEIEKMRKENEDD